MLLVVLTAVFLSASARAAPGDTLFADDFEDGTLPAWTTSNGARSGVSNAAGWATSGSWGAYTANGVVTVTSPAFNAAVPEARLTLWIRRGADFFSEDTDGNEDLVLEYQRADNSWAPLRTYFGSGTNGQQYNETFTLPPDALHGSLALRVRQTGGSGVSYDFWHFDDVRVTEIAPAASLGVGSCDDFENGLTANWTVNTGSGFAGISAATSQSPNSSLYVNGGTVNVASNVVDTSDATFGDLTVWIRRGDDLFSEDPDGGENLVLEYFDSGGTWVALETFSGPGAGGQIFLRAYDLPAAGRHAGFRLRFRQTGGSGAPWDFWHVDDVCFDLSTDPVLLVTKLSQTLSDPINGSSSPKAIPGATILYTMGVTNAGLGTVDNDTMTISDVIPTNTALFVDSGSGDPIAFVDGAVSSGLSFNFGTDVGFSNQPGGGGPYTYVPVPDAQGFDPAVTGIQVSPSGVMNAAAGGSNPSFNVLFRVRID